MKKNKDKVKSPKKTRKERKAEKMTEREKVEERREEVLARGRKFKYPLQYAKHRLVLNTIIIVLVALMVLVGTGWFALYQAQSNNDMLYRLTRFIPVPVAEIDGEQVRYSDYLMIYRSSITPVEQQGQLGDEVDEEVIRAHYKRESLNEAEDYAYALKLGKELGVEVTSQMIDEAILEHRKVGGVERSEESFTRLVRDNFGLSMDEYRRMVYLSLMKVEVSKAIDEEARKTINEVEKRLKENGGDFIAVLEALGDKISYEETGGLVDKKNVDGGRATMAITLEVGETSKVFMSSNGDGYYIVKLIGKTDSEVNYASIKVPLTEFERRIAEVREANKIKEYIKLADNEQ